MAEQGNVPEEDKPGTEPAAQGEAHPGGENGGGGISRRALLGGAGVGVGGLIVGGVVGYAAGDSGSDGDGGSAEATEELNALAQSEANTLEAVLERLLPSDETGPGAKEANVLRYIDRSLAGELDMFHGPYVQALAAIDAYALARYGGEFANLGAEDQDAVLTDMAEGKAQSFKPTEKAIEAYAQAEFGSAAVDLEEDDREAALDYLESYDVGFTPDSAAVFEMLRTHAIQGMFGDPAHGGNVGFVGWELVRFPGPRLAITSEEQALDAVPENRFESTYDNNLFKNTTVET
jgi:gluconate 2-dehydrogenase gamma chain